MIDLNQLMIFTKVVENQSFTKAVVPLLAHVPTPAAGEEREGFRIPKWRSLNQPQHAKCI